jgi:hypothetical protein
MKNFLSFLIFSSHISKETWKVSLKLGEMLGYFEHGQITARLVIIILICLTYISCQLVGIYHVWPDLLQLSRTLPFYTLNLQIGAGLLKRLRNDEELTYTTLKKFTEFAKREHKDPDHREILNAHLLYTKWLMKALTWLAAVIIFSPLTTATVLSIYKREFILYAPIHIPFIDPETLSGFIIHISYLGLLTYLTFFIFAFIHTRIAFFASLLHPRSKIFIQKVRKLRTELINQHEVVAKEKDLSMVPEINFNISNKPKELTFEFIDIVKEFHLYEEFISFILSTNYGIHFTIMFFDSIAMCFFIIVMLYFSYPIGFAAGVGMLFQMLSACVCGDVIKTCKNKIIDEIAEFPWFYLPRKDQKIFLQLIHLCQNAQEQKILFIGIVDMEMFTNVINASYSYYQIIQNFVPL